MKLIYLKGKKTQSVVGNNTPSGAAGTTITLLLLPFLMQAHYKEIQHMAALQQGDRSSGSRHPAVSSPQLLSPLSSLSPHLWSKASPLLVSDRTTQPALLTGCPSASMFSISPDGSRCFPIERQLLSPDGVCCRLLSWEQVRFLSLDLTLGLRTRDWTRVSCLISAVYLITTDKMQSYFIEASGNVFGVC